MPLKLSPFILKLHNLAVKCAPISTVFFPPSNALVRAQSSCFHSLRCDVKSVEAEGNRSMESWRLNVKSGETGGISGMESSILDEQTLQRNLKKAIEEENYARAAELRDSLQFLKEESKALVLAANSRFYDAFTNGDLAAMQTIWAEMKNVYVVHPGEERTLGYELVMRSWKSIFGAKHEFPMQIDLKNVEIHVEGDVGYVTCMEVENVEGDVGYVTCMEVEKNEGSRQRIRTVTNVFERIDGKWYMCIHHASEIDPYYYEEIVQFWGVN